MTQDEVVKKYSEEDPRLQDPITQNKIRANDIGVFDYDTLFTIGKGSFEIHKLNVFGKDVRFRVLTMQEEAEIEHSTAMEIQNNPLYSHLKNGSLEYNARFYKLQLLKTISLASTPSIHNTENDKKGLKETDLMKSPAVTVAGLISAYQDIEKQYNPPIENYSEEAINEIVSRLFDPKQRAAIIAGLDLWLMRIILATSFEMLTAQEVNTSIVTSLENGSPKEEIEK